MRRPTAWLWVWAALAAWAGQLPAQGPKLPDGVKALRDLEYVKDGHERQKLDLYLPEKADGPLPVVVWIHGGAWRAGSKDGCPGVFLAAKGFAVASVGYRLSQHAVFPAQIEDCKAAIRWLRGNAKKYNLDPDHIGAWGASAGGHLVALLGTTGGMKELEGKDGDLDQLSQVQCVLDWFGPTDFRDLRGAVADDPKSVIAQLLGGPPSKEKDKAALASPVAHVHKGCPPFLIMHGDKDPTVSLGASKKLAEALEKADVPVTLVVLEGAGHGGKEFGTEESRNRIEAFFTRHLKPSAKAPEDKVLFEETFAGDLGKDWSWVREEPRAWKIDKGALVLRTLPGYLHAKSNDSKNVLLRPLPRSDRPLAVEVYVESEPKVQFEHAGIVWYVDDDNYVSLFQEVLNGKVELQMVTEKEAKPRFAVEHHDARGVWMRLLIADGKITSQFRPTEKDEWKTVGQSELPAPGPGRVGVMAGGAPKDAERYVRFRSFRIVEIAKDK
jgi:acetyl esterase/lipase/regulation of enolase protein 1 (concanavalin A-like superfamily)